MIKRLQALLQWLFLRVEGLFNAAFGDRLNPLYHLGSITFYLFWLVAGSGLYLYAFFETGVADAYASVQALTLIVMAVAAPVRSQGGAADLARAVTEVQLDWFYLLVFPLLTLCLLYTSPSPRDTR